MPAPQLPPANTRASTAPPPPRSDTLDQLLVELASGQRTLLASRPVTLQNQVRRGTPLPRCSPAGLRQAIGAYLQGLTAVAAPSSLIIVRAERKPVLMRGRDGREEKRDYLMLSFSHTDGLGAEGQARLLKGVQPGPLGEGYQALRELGGFLRFAPLPGQMLESRLFLPL